MCEPGPRSENKKEFTRVETRSPQRENKLENSVRAVVGSSCNCLLPSVLFFCSLSTFLVSFPFFLFILVAAPVLKSRAELREQLSVDQLEKLTRAAESCSVAKRKCFRLPIESLPIRPRTRVLFLVNDEHYREIQGLQNNAICIKSRLFEFDARQPGQLACSF